MSKDDSSLNADFASLLEEYMDPHPRFEGTLVTARVIRISGDSAIVDVGLKSEGRIPLREISDGKNSVSPGDKIDLFVERYEDRDGLIVLSRERARREETWGRLIVAHDAKERVQGYISGKVKGGFTVDLSGVSAFLPGSQVDIRPARDVGHLMGQVLQFMIIKIDRPRGNVVISRRAVMESDREGQRAELMLGLKEGSIFTGMVKNMTEYGAFVDIGGVDGLLHVTDMSWKRVNSPADVVSIGQQIRVVVIRYNAETQRISLGLKQLESDPWESVGDRFPRNQRVKGRITNVADYGAFVELDAGIEGLIHVSEMSWLPNGIHPGRIVSVSEEVEVIVLDVDPTKRRISLGLKQARENPWEIFINANPLGSVVEGQVLSVSEDGIKISLAGGIEGLVAPGEISWEEAPAPDAYSVGQTISLKILSADTSVPRIDLGIRQLLPDAVGDALKSVRRDSVVTCTVTAIQTNGIAVKIGDVLTGFIRRAELGRDRADQRPDRFAVGEKVDALVLAVDPAERKLSLSVKGRERDEGRKAIADFGSSNSGASLGDILSAAIMKRRETV
jgi:small subunit ribosomal protein S1